MESFKEIKNNLGIIINKFSFIRFCLVGGILFIIDIALLWWLIYQLDFTKLTARCISATVSLIISWLLHRNYTFAAIKANNILYEYIRYILCVLLSFFINLFVYLVLIEKYNIFWHYPVLAVIIATTASMGVSYLFMKKIVFLKK